MHTYKARLVVKGFRQKHGINYDETFLSVAMLKSIRIMLAIVAYYDYEIWQMEVKTAFLNGNLEEDVYITRELPHAINSFYLHLYYFYICISFYLKLNPSL